MKILKPGKDFKSIYEPCLLCGSLNFFPWVGQRKLCTGCRAFVRERKIKGMSDEAIMAEYREVILKLKRAGEFLDAMEVPTDGRMPM